MMGLILVRYAELGLKSERVRSRFISRLLDDIGDMLLSSSIEHVITTERGRIFIETDEVTRAMDILRSVPGIYSFSEVMKVPSDMDELMEGLSEFARTRLIEGMTFGLRVRRTGDLPYSSREVAIRGGDAVCSHLDDTKVKVDLKDPDIWFEVEVRSKSAYIFTERIKGLGGMPKATQGKVVLYLPPISILGMGRDEAGSRAALSRSMMTRRGCRVIPVLHPESLGEWEPFLNELKEDGKDPFLLEGENDLVALADAVSKTGANGIVHPGDSSDIPTFPVVHSTGASVSVLYPTIAFSKGEVEVWNERLGRPPSM